MSSLQKTLEHQAVFARQAVILRKNLNWKLDDWETCLGKLNASFHSVQTLDRSIPDVLQHFVFLPLKATANPPDMPFFLSSRLEALDEDTEVPNAAQHLTDFDKQVRQHIAEYEESMIRFK